MVALTNKEKQQALRKRRADAGLKEVRGIWMTIEDEKMTKKILRKAQKLVTQSENEYKKQCNEGKYLVDKPLSLCEAIKEITENLPDRANGKRDNV